MRLCYGIDDDRNELRCVNATQSSNVAEAAPLADGACGLRTRIVLNCRILSRSYGRMCIKANSSANHCTEGAPPPARCNCAGRHYTKRSQGGRAMILVMWGVLRPSGASTPDGSTQLCTYPAMLRVEQEEQYGRLPDLLRVGPGCSHHIVEVDPLRTFQEYLVNREVARLLLRQDVLQRNACRCVASWA